MRKLSENTKFVQSISLDGGQTSTVTGDAVDTQGYKSAVLAVIGGATVNGTVQLETSDTSNFASSEDLGSAVTVVADDTVFVEVPECNLNGAKRYLRAVLTAAGATDVTATIILTEPDHAPVA